ncbi:MAG: GH36-type glycosyl hydrolase domain-containing protein, partial [Ardenticatenaceae bacterium]
VVMTSAGSGYSNWQEIALTRWRADTTCDDWGTWLYVQDLQSGALWSAGYQPTGTRLPEGPGSYEVSFYPHMVQIRRRDGEIALVVEIVVAPEDDVEIRRVTMTNHGEHARRMRLTSYGEVVLAPDDADRRHPAFQKLFVESEYLPGENTLLFRRRPRSASEEPVFLAHALVGPAGAQRGHHVTSAFEADRARFLGRGRTARAPLALIDPARARRGTVGATLDPIMALSREIALDPHESVTLAYLTLATRSRGEAVAQAGRFQDWELIERSFNHAHASSERELRRVGLTSPDLQRIEQLLSLLLYPHPALRADPDTLAANEKGQSGLWGYAISGDYPILLVRIAAEEETALVQELLRAHEFWRGRQVNVDLVILNEKESGYAQEVQRQLHQLLQRTENDNWLNRRGGLFLLRADQMSASDRVLLETAARVILDGSQGSLARQLEEVLAQPVRLPALLSSRPPEASREPTPPLERPTDLLFDNGLGGFSPDGREYLLYLVGHASSLPRELEARSTPWTPAPWSNVIANPDFGFLVTEAGGGYSWALNSGENRLTPWSNDPVSDEPVEALYLRDEETAEVWSSTPLPAGTPSAPYLVRHGAGYSSFEHHSHGLKQRLRLFVAPDAPLKIIHLRLENCWQRVRRITATYYAPWVLATFRDQAQAYIQPEYVDEQHALLARNPYNAEFGERIAFLAASARPHGLTTDRTEFLGRMGTPAAPAALKRIGLSGKVAPGLDPCAAIQLHLDLQPGESQEIYFLLGQGENRDESLRLIEHFRQPDRIAAAWQAVAEQWERLLGAVTVKTPDPAMNLLLNRWLLYQALACRVWGRSAFYQSSGAFGFRDQLQDVMALLHARPEIAREHI